MYNIRIANIGKIGSNGAYTFSEANINNLPNINVFIEPELNNKIIDGCKEVLYRSMNRKNVYRYGEQGLLISLLSDDIHINFNGTYDTIKTKQSEFDYNKIVNSRNVSDLVFIHNHPNNSNFSASDLRHLNRDKGLLAIVAVGNRSNLHIVIKTGNCNNIDKYIDSCIKVHMNKYNIQNINDIDINTLKKLESKASSYILQNPEKFNIEYDKYYRRSLR